MTTTPPALHLSGPGSPRAAASRRARRAARGFTMIELLVATIAGLTVSLGAFAFARASTRTFQQETRLSDATGNVTIGFRRLISDVERAGYLAPSNIQREFYAGNRVCLQPGNAYPKGIQSLAGIRIAPGGSGGYVATGTTSVTSTQALPSGTNITLSPDQLTLTGSYSSNEQFAVRAVDTSGGAPVVILETMSGAAMRTASALNPNDVTPWSRIFAPGRILRLVDRQGYQHFGTIAGVALGAGSTPRITLTSTPALYMRGSAPPVPANPACSGFELGVGAVANVINRIRYEVRDLRGVTGYEALYPNPPVLAEDSDRYELVRYELDQSGAVIAGTTELVAEYAVDLKTALTVIDNTLNPANPQPTLLPLPFGAADITKWGREVTMGDTTPGPERIRSVRVRLSVRSREPDRATGLDPSPGSPADTLLRYQFPSNKARFARVRTLQAEVGMSNQTSVFF